MLQLCLKGEKKSSPSNYRPISLTVTLCKVLESSTRDKIIDHLERYTLIKDSQHGFVKFVNVYGRGQKVINNPDSGYPMDAIFLDFQKAFDKVPH